MAFRPVRIHIPSREEFWNRWRRLAGPSLFFLAVIYYEELFLKLYCFHGVSLPGLLFTLLFSAPPAHTGGRSLARGPPARVTCGQPQSGF